MTERNRLNIRGILDLDQMSSLLLNIVKKLDDQEEKLWSLENAVDKSLIENKTIIDRLDQIEEWRQKTSNRLEAIQAASTVNLFSKKIPCNELAESNYEQINLIQKTISCLISHEEVDEKFQPVIKLISNVHQLRDEYINTCQIVNQLENASTHSISKLVHLEQMMTGKVDVIELMNIRTLATKLEGYHKFRNETQNSLNTIQQIIQSHESQLQHHQNELINIQKNVNVLHDDLKKSALKKDLHVLAKELQLLQTQSLQFVTTETLRQTDESLHTAVTQLHEAQQHLRDIDHHLIQMRNDLMTKATLKHLQENYVNRPHYEQMVTSLGTELDMKANYKMMEQLQKEVKELNQFRYEDIEKLSIVLRFVEWFTSRGENYEHNLKIIDKHLKNLIPQSPHHQHGLDGYTLLDSKVPGYESVGGPLQRGEPDHYSPYSNKKSIIHITKIQTNVSSHQGS